MLILAEYFSNDWSNTTTIHPLGATILLILIAFVLLVPRRYMVVPFIIMACVVPQAQRVVIFELDFHFIRILATVGAARVLARQEYSSYRWQTLDSLVAAFVLLWVTAAAIKTNGDMGSILNIGGLSYDMILLYGIFRCAVRSCDDVVIIAGTLLIVSIPAALFALVENQTGRNLFSLMGGVPEHTVVRDGRLRSQGPFGHAILAGCFWAASLPLISAMWWLRPHLRHFVVTGGLAAIALVVLSASSTPIFAVASGAFAAAMYRLRTQLTWIRWTVLIALVALHFLMVAPVWHLLSRIPAVGGSTGWHRYFLIDQWLKHIEEWFWIGSIKGSEHWGHALYDITNQYIVFAMHGGIILLLLCIGILWIAFREIGRMTSRAATAGERVASWATGSALFVHAASFIGVAYFGQIAMLFYLNLAMIGSLAAASRSRMRMTKNVLGEGTILPTPNIINQAGMAEVARPD